MFKVSFALFAFALALNVQCEKLLSKQNDGECQKLDDSMVDEIGRKLFV